MPLNSKRMPHLPRHALDGIRVLALGKLLITYVKDYSNAYRYQQSFQKPMLPCCLSSSGNMATDGATRVAGMMPASWSGSLYASARVAGLVLTFCSNVPSMPQDGRSRAAASA